GYSCPHSRQVSPVMLSIQTPSLSSIPVSGAYPPAAQLAPWSCPAFLRLVMVGDSPHNGQRGLRLTGTARQRGARASYVSKRSVSSPGSPLRYFTASLAWTNPKLPARLPMIPAS